MPNTVAFNADYPDISKSDELYARAAGLMPAWSQTLAKGPTQYVNGVAPKYLERGSGSHVWDVDGNEYIDWTMGVGPLSLGYAYPATNEAIAAQLANGIAFSLTHRLEVEVSELLRAVIPNAEMVRISKTGADVTSAAIRVARAHTGRNKVLTCGYHGWHDWYVATMAARTAGVPEQVKELVNTFSYNDIDSLTSSLDDDTAAVIMEPMTFDFPQDDFLHKVREACTANGTVLIFDEMWTGFRWALGGAQEYFGVDADLATFSKAVANGMPVSFLVGKADLMQLLHEDIFFFTTFGGEALSLAATIATINEMRDKHVQAYLAEKGQTVIDTYNDLALEYGMDYTRAKGHPARSLVVFDASAGDPLLMKSFVQQELVKRGVLWSGFHNMSFSHTDADIDYTFTAYRDVLPMLKDAVAVGNLAERLRGEPVQPVFRKTSDFNTKPKQR